MNMNKAGIAVSGAVVVITGASYGIGAATARVFAEAGASVVLAARSAASLHQLASTLPGSPLVIPTDVSDEQQARSLIERTIGERGRVDVLINNAGIGLSEPIESITTADLNRVFAVNVFGPLYTMQAVLPHMRQRARGHIINVSSIVGWYALPYAGGYAASKAALDRMTEAVRMETRGSGITITLVRPGATTTAFHEHRLGRNLEKRRGNFPSVPPEVVARKILTTVQHPRRVVYVTMRDRLLVIMAMLAPGIVDRFLTELFSWEKM